MNFHLFRRKRTQGYLWLMRVKAFFVGAAIILFWRGIWNLADIFLFAGNPIQSSTASILIGMGILMLSGNFVSQFVDDAVEDSDDYE